MRSILRASSALILVALFAGAIHAQATDSTLSYYDQNRSYLFFPLPGQYGVTSGQDTARTVVAYSERFTSPWPTTYLSSVDVAMRIDELQGGAWIPIEIRKAVISNGHFFADYSSAPIERDSLHVEQIKPGKLYPYTGLYNTTQPMDSTFFISVSVTDTANTKAAIAADDSTSASFDGTIDDSLDRAQLLLDKPYHGQTQIYMAGSQWPSLEQPYDVSNFVMIAHITNALGSSADVYPARVDPFAYFIERTAAGELIIHYSLKDAALATISLYDSRGTLVETLLNDREFTGAHELPVTKPIASGMYYAKLTANGVTEVRPVAITR